MNLSVSLEENTLVQLCSNEQKRRLFRFSRKSQTEKKKESLVYSVA